MLLTSGCLGGCETLGYSATIVTPHDEETIRAAFEAEGWTSVERDDRPLSFRRDDQSGATVLLDPEGASTIRFENDRTEERSRAVASPIAARLGADVRVEELTHCGSV